MPITVLYVVELPDGPRPFSHAIPAIVCALLASARLRQPVALMVGRRVLDVLPREATWPMIASSARPT